MPKRKCSSVDVTFGRNISKYRRQCGLTQQQVADILNLNRSTYTKYETGISEPSIEILKSIASIFDIDYNAALGFEGSGVSFSDSDEPFAKLNYDEGILIGMFRTFDDEEKKSVVDFVKTIRDERQARSIAGVTKKQEKTEE